MAEVRKASYVLPGADIGPENPLPIFRLPEQEYAPCIVEGVPAGETRRIRWQTEFRVLPYRMQDGYTADRQAQAFDAVVMENEHLKAIFVPALGGHMMSLVHKPSTTELLDRNPVFQPRNLALRNAWISGGIEFNAGQLGHHYLTCAPLHTCRVQGPQGEPGLRMYAWDRVKRFTYQMDFYLPDGAQFLFMHVRIVNALDCEIPMYWWTNMGVPEKKDRMVLVPADTCIYNDRKGFALGHLPEIDGYDVPRTTSIKHSMEFFFRMPATQRRWIATLDRNGKGFIQTSTDRLIGRKLFVWGTSQGGKRWQEYLAAPGRAYVEIQAGLTQTQCEHIPMPAHSEWTWTEAFGMMAMDPAKVHGAAWHAAWTATDAGLEAALPRATLDALHLEFDKLAARPCGEMLHGGLGWGALERRRAKAAGEADTIPEELRFDPSDLGDDQAAWLALLDTGKFPEKCAGQDPGQFMIQPEWKALLQQSAESGASNHWLGWYHLGVAHVEAGEIKEAVRAWDRSLAQKRTGWALRNLAALELREQRKEAARALYRDAWETGPRNAYLANEYAALLLDMGLNRSVVDLINAMPEEIRSNERLRLMRAWAKVRMDDFHEAGRLFEHEFVTMKEGEGSLANLWFEMHERKTAKERGAPIDDALKAKVRHDFPLPAKIDFRVTSEVAERNKREQC